MLDLVPLGGGHAITHCWTLYDCVQPIRDGLKLCIDGRPPNRFQNLQADAD